MAFYEEIAQHYDDIFPVAAAQREFLLTLAGPAPCRVLDVACGTGGYSAALAEAGHETLACDLDPAMVGRAAARPGVFAFAADMSRLDQTPELNNLTFGLVFCIGNSLVHLPDRETAAATLVQFHKLLEPGGRLLLQIINYDRIIDQQIPGLPAIENPAAGLRFTRQYRLDAESGRVAFTTELILADQSGSLKMRSFVNTVELLALRSGELQQFCRQAGFADIRLYGGFSGQPFEIQKSQPLVLVAQKSR